MTIQQTERAREILMDDVFVKHMVERLRKIIWSVTGCSDSLAELAAGEVADYIAAMPSIPQESDAEVTEAMLVVKNSPLKITLPDYWRTCAHEWAIYGDGGDLGGNRIEVQCRKCKCPGDYDEDHMEVVWPTT